MAGLIAKKLSKLPIGTPLELSYGDSRANIVGKITDSDFESEIEVTCTDGSIHCLKCELVNNYRPLTNISVPVGTASVPNTATASTSVSTPKPTPNPTPTPTPAPTPNPSAPITSHLPLHKQPLMFTPGANDLELKKLFDSLPLQDRKKLNGTYDSFRYGLKSNDSGKVSTAASAMRAELWRQYNSGYDWAIDTYKFCGHVLRRAKINDPEVFLYGDCYWEAAWTSNALKDPISTAAYSALGLLEGEQDHRRDLWILLATGIVQADDASVLRVMYQRGSVPDPETWRTLLSELLSAKGLSLSAMQDSESIFHIAETLYPGRKSSELLLSCFPKDSEPDTDAANTSAVSPNTGSAQESSFEEKYGYISYLYWADHRGIITDDEGNKYNFAYDNLKTTSLLKMIKNCLHADLDGKIYPVKFIVQKGEARNIFTDNTVVERARSIATNPQIENRFRKAYAVCKTALKTTDGDKALYELIKNALAISKAEDSKDILVDALKLYEENAARYPDDPFPIAEVAQCYYNVGRCKEALEHMDHIFKSSKNMVPVHHLTLLKKAMQFCEAAYNTDPDKAMAQKLLQYSDEWVAEYKAHLNSEPGMRSVYQISVLPQRIRFECILNRLEAAQADLDKLSIGNENRPRMQEMVQQLREKLAPTPTVSGKEEATAPLSLPDAGEVCPTASDVPEYDDTEEADETDESESILPYKDENGWEALGLTKEAVIDYALSIRGEDALPSILTYLNAGASLCPEIRPLYRMVALASNDPLAACDYTPTALLNAMAEWDPKYPELNDLCIAAAFLRASFVCGRGYDYSTRSLRSGIHVTQKFQSLEKAYDLLEEFRKETNNAMDIYADYRNQGAKKLAEEKEELLRTAQELYTKFIDTVPRESARFARILDTKKAVFDKNGYLATMLRHILRNEREELQGKEQHFIATYLNRNTQTALTTFNIAAVEEMITDAWDKAGLKQQSRKANKTLQGDRRNNLKSGILDILSAIRHWYLLSEQEEGYSWRTESGEEAYIQFRSRLLEILPQLYQECQEEMEAATTDEYRTGVFLLQNTARELCARLDGSWEFGEERFMYVDFLRSDNIMLNEDFTPELSSTFCSLPEFNILARIRRHVEQEKMSFSDHIARIYGQEQSCNNYGTARLIVEYLKCKDQQDTVSIPENAHRFIEQTELQAQMSLRNFREAYALSTNCGQIMKNDSFCSGLNDIVLYWHNFCSKTQNFGFFHELTCHADTQVHVSAGAYEKQLEEQLDALIANNRAAFDAQPGYAEAIRGQIAQQNFTVAEDWMHRIRLGDISLEVQQPEALNYLNRFWSEYVELFGKVANAGNPLGSMMTHLDARANKDTKAAQKLVDNWIYGKTITTTQKIETLLDLLGWKNITASLDKFPGDPRLDLFKITKTSPTGSTNTPIHPIAAFGSKVDSAGMHVVCLYGMTDCDRLIAKIQALDNMNGNKIIFLDFALGGTDRRALAQMLKKRELALRNTFIVVDRVVIAYLAKHYNESLINRMLMAVTLPFTYYQPYIADSIHTLPNEMFIGRKDELLRIEDPAGVNLIYGGRQLGKSALLKKAKMDIDGRQGNRAILIDIKDCDCAATARALSRELISLKILTGTPTEDWEELCFSIKERLRSEAEQIPYLLVMMDEADTFIDDCANYSYRPMDLLKDIQQSLPEQFKFVLAGLHNVVRFNRDVALGRNSVITHIPSLKITPFRTPEAQELLTVPLSYLGFSLPSKVTISQILATVNYFPGLIQLYCKKLLESVRMADYAGYDTKNSPPYIVTDDHIRRVIADREFMDQIRDKFEITLKLDKDQGSYYYPLALLVGWMYCVEPSKNGYTAADVLRHANDTTFSPIARLDEEKIDALMQELQDLNILRSVSHNTYLLASKNFRDLLGSQEEIFEKMTKLGGAAE